MKAQDYLNDEEPKTELDGYIDAWTDIAMAIVCLDIIVLSLWLNLVVV